MTIIIVDNIKIEADEIAVDILSSEADPSIDLDGFVSHIDVEPSETGADIGLDLLVNKRKQLEEPLFHHM